MASSQQDWGGVRQVWSCVSSLCYRHADSLVLFGLISQRRELFRVRRVQLLHISWGPWRHLCRCPAGLVCSSFLWRFSVKLIALWRCSSTCPYTGNQSISKAWFKQRVVGCLIITSVSFSVHKLVLSFWQSRFRLTVQIWDSPMWGCCQVLCLDIYLKW